MSTTTSSSAERSIRTAPDPSLVNPAPRPTWTPAGWLQRYSLLVILAVLFVVCLLAIPAFRSSSLISTMINAQSIILILALIATVVLRTGDFDLSVSQTMVGSAAVVAVLSANGQPPAVAILSALAVGLVVGLVNAILVVRIGVDSFITTLGSFTAMAGFAYLVTGSRIVTQVPDFFVDLARSTVLGLPLVTWYAWILVAVLWFVYQRTPLGRYMLFIGGNHNAARLAGLPIDRIRMGAYIASGLLASLGGIVFAGYFGAVDPSVGGQYMLQPFAAAYLGATAIAVGRFNALGTVIALYLLAVGITGLQVLGAQNWVTNMFYGIALMGAVTAAKLVSRRSAARSK
jgi:ribose transport system permease protein